MSKKELIRIIRELMRFNPLHNDLDAYLYELEKFAVGDTKEKPNRKDFGLE
jgi:hypothetical protein